MSDKPGKVVLAEGGEIVPPFGGPNDVLDRTSWIAPGFALFPQTGGTPNVEVSKVTSKFTSNFQCGRRPEAERRPP